MTNKKKYAKKSLAILIALMMLLTSLLVVPLAMGAEGEEEAEEATEEAAEAAEEAAEEEEGLSDKEAADILFKLGLFKGIGDDADGNPDFALGQNLKRKDGMILQIRLTGEEEEALKGEFDCPFEDVTDELYQKYIGYAFEKGYTKGVSETEFEPDNDLSAAMYLTYILRAMGYEDGVDFEWDSAWILTDELGITHGEYNEENSTMSRGDVAVANVYALVAENADGQLLIAALVESGAIDAKEALEVIAELEELGLIDEEVAKEAAKEIEKAEEVYEEKAAAAEDDPIIAKKTGSGIDSITYTYATPSSLLATTTSLTASATLLTATGQSIQFAIGSDSVTVPDTWLPETTNFTVGVGAGNNFFIWARSASDSTYNAGAPKVSGPFNIVP